MSSAPDWLAMRSWQRVHTVPMPPPYGATPERVDLGASRERSSAVSNVVSPLIIKSSSRNINTQRLRFRTPLRAKSARIVDEKVLDDGIELCNGIALHQEMVKARGHCGAP